MKKIISLTILLNSLLCLSQTEQQLDSYKGTCSGTNTYTVSISTIIATSYYDGQKVWLKFTNANTGASTLSINGIAAKGITLNKLALTSGQIITGTYVGFVYDITTLKWQMQKPNISAWSITGNSGTVDTVSFIGTTDNVPFNIRVNNQQSGRIDPNSLNTFLGYQSGKFITVGSWNTAVGSQALYSDTSGVFNTAIGGQALLNNLRGNANTALGYLSSKNDLSGNNNVSVGANALYENVSGSGATAIGYGAMQNANNTVTPFTNLNVAVGYEALKGSGTPSANTGNSNTAIGYQTLLVNTSGAENLAIGKQALVSNNIGFDNTAIGSNSLQMNTTGSYNTANGWYTLANNTEGNFNVAIGLQALLNNKTGSYNIAIGVNSGLFGNWSNKLFIDNQSRTDSATQLRKSLVVGTFGTDSSVQNIRINGSLQISDGTQGNGKIFTSNANGVGSWQTNSGSLPYLEYVAIVYQTGTSAPVDSVLFNNIGTITWGYTSSGIYTVNSSGLFTAGKTFYTPSNFTYFNSGGGLEAMQHAYTSTSVITINGFPNLGDGALFPAALGGMEVTIRVYP